MKPYILVVDNNPIDLEFLSYLLTAMGYRAKTAPSVQAGLAAMRRAAPCFIISDLNLPHRTGFDFLKRVKSEVRWRDIPFVLISATSHSQSDIGRALRMGAAKYILRPIEPHALLAEIKPYLPPPTPD